MSEPTPEEIEEKRRRASQPERAQPEKDENPLFTLIKALLSFFIRALQPDKSAPDFEDGPQEPQKRQQVRIEYEQSRLKIEEALPRYSESIPSGRSVQINSAQYAARLMKMRQDAEAANGGARIEGIIPVEGDGRVTSDVGHRHSPMKGASTDHGALDFASPTPGQKPNIRSTMPGIVVGVGWREGYGNTVDVMDIYGHTQRYAHLDSYSVKPGDDIAQGAKLGVMGTTGRSTGVHLHYEERDQSGKKLDPVLMGRTWKEGERFSGKQNEAFLAAQFRPDDAPVVASAPQVSAAAAASVAQAGIKPSSLTVADTHDHSHDAPAGGKPARGRT